MTDTSNYLSDDDVILMLKFQQGDNSAFEQLLEKYHAPIINFIFKFIADRFEAEDLAQNVFLSIYRSQKTYVPRAKFSTWIYTIARNLALNELRRKRNRKESSLEETIENEGGNMQKQRADNNVSSAAKELEKQELAGIVKEVIDSLPQHQKTAVILRRYENFSYDEIARVIGCSVSAVKSLLSRAKSALKEGLAPYFKG